MVKGEGRLPVLGILNVGAQHFGNAPGLRKTAARAVRGVPIEHLGNLTQPSVAKVRAQCIEKLIRPAAGLFGMPVHLYIS